MGTTATGEIDPGSPRVRRASVTDQTGSVVSVAPRPAKLKQINEVHCVLPPGARLLLDDVLLFGRLRKPQPLVL